MINVRQCERDSHFFFNLTILLNNTEDIKTIDYIYINSLKLPEFTMMTALHTLHYLNHLHEVT